ncbi:MAG TPA: hypothetical protein VF608_12090, partial [Thermoanaerobaculia bacterium]
MFRRSRGCRERDACLADARVARVDERFECRERATLQRLGFRRAILRGEHAAELHRRARPRVAVIVG